MRDFIMMIVIGCLGILTIAYLVFATPGIVADHLTLHADRLVHEANI